MEVEDESLIFTFNKNASLYFKQNVCTVLYITQEEEVKRKKEKRTRDV
jgi:NifB/MoaA-like Fe-S oxidoreductase